MKIQINNGTLEGLKWLALVLMTLDHVNKYLLDEKATWLFEAGRICMPLFCFILAYKLAHYAKPTNRVYQRTMKRLFMYGALASLPFHLLIGYWPLNIMFMLLLSVFLIFSVDTKQHIGLVIAGVIVAGAFVEFWWWGIALTYVFWSFYKKPSALKIAIAGLIVAALFVINQNHYALLVFPIIFAATKINLNVPRAKNIFYWFYPVHLGIIYAVAQHLK